MMGTTNQSIASGGETRKVPSTDLHESENSCQLYNHKKEHRPWISEIRRGSLTCQVISHIPHENNKLSKCEDVTHPTICLNHESKFGRSHRYSVLPLRCARSHKRSTRMGFLLLLLVCVSLLPEHAIAQPLDFNSELSESFSSSRGENLGTSNNLPSFEDTELSAKEFLAKFGYVKPAEWTSVSPRHSEFGFNSEIIEGEGTSDWNKNINEGSGSDEEDKVKNLVTWSYDEISEEEYQRALIKYQRINGLNATGELDNDTQSYMGRPRCGVPDRTAAIKVNRTDPLVKTTTTTIAPFSTISDNKWINSATNAIPTDSTTYTTNSTTTNYMSNDSTTQIPTETTVAIHVITTAGMDLEPESSGDFDVQSTQSEVYKGMDDNGSGDTDQLDIGDQTLSRRRRSEDRVEEIVRMEAGFEELTPTGTPSSQVNEDFDVLSEFDLNDIRTRRLNFKDLNDAPISEAELPDETRVASLENILEALRKEKQSQINATIKADVRSFDDLVTSIRPTPAPAVPALVKRLVMDSRAKRRKRSNAYLYGKTNGWLMAFPKRVITWRLVEEWPTKRPFMISNEIWFTIKLAFRMWSEILPRNFREDNTSPMTNVDILLGFGRKEHNRCPVPFYDGRFTREYAHAWPLPQAEVHFNDDQPFVSMSWEPSRDIGLDKPVSSYGIPISLIKVATHEIGHTLGLPHNKDKTSVMNPVYIPYPSKKVMELKSVDRQAIQSVYGSCNLQFDAVFDWVRQYVGADGVKRWKYNTFFFRKTWFWLYENRSKRPRYGDPKYSFDFWRGVLDGPSDPHRNIDGVVHIRDWSLPNGPIYFFTGDTFTEYDSVMDRVKTKDSEGRAYPRSIKDGFPGIPYPIDSVFYKWQESLLYFFKGDYVYKFDWKKGRIVTISTISSTFKGWGGAASLPNNIDSAYYSYTDSAYYFFKGIYYWKMADQRERIYNKAKVIPENAVGPRQLISSHWKYICDVDETEMQMTLPSDKT